MKMYQRGSCAGHRHIRMRNRDQRIRFSGVYTIEAAIIFPIIVFLIAFILQIGMTWYSDVQQGAEDTEVLRQLDTRKYFLDVSMLNAIKEQVKQYEN